MGAYYGPIVSIPGVGKSRCEKKELAGRIVAKWPNICNAPHDHELGDK